MDYKLLQLTNTNIGAVSINGFMPLGNVTGRINCPYKLDGSISVSNSGSDVIVIGTQGHYILTYSPTLTIAEAGNITLSIIVNGTSVYSTTIVGAVGNNQLYLIYEFKVKNESIPTNVQIQLTSSAITGGTSNTLVEKVW